MLTREIANAVQADQQQAADMNASAIRQFEALIRAALIVTKVQVQIASEGKTRWDFAGGLASAILPTPAGAVGDGQYDAAYLRAVQAMWASYTVWLATPIVVTVNGQQVDLGKRPLDLIMSTPTLAQAVEEQTT